MISLQFPDCNSGLRKTDFEFLNKVKSGNGVFLFWIFKILKLQLRIHNADIVQIRSTESWAVSNVHDKFKICWIILSLRLSDIWHQTVNTCVFHLFWQCHKLVHIHITSSCKYRWEIGQLSLLSTDTLLLARFSSICDTLNQQKT